MDLATTSFETLALEPIDEHLLVVRFNRPEAANAMNTQMGLDLRDLWQAIYVEPGELRCVVLTGAGERAFCAGGDLKEREGMTDAAWQRQHAIFEQAVLALIECPVPVVAAVNGAAYGGGTELALACDFVYAARRARFALTEITLGIIPGAMGTQNLPRAVGTRRAKELILTGSPFSAEDAHAWGMVNRLCEDGALLEETLEAARRIARNAPLSTRRAKRVMSVAGEVDLHSGYALELEAYNRLVPTEDRLEGVRAFNEKRAPRFRGR
jgi:enoyl-CoA hydratase/carnithine racemase